MKAVLRRVAVGAIAATFWASIGSTSLSAADPVNACQGAARQVAGAATTNGVDSIYVVVRLLPNSAGDLDPKSILVRLTEEFQGCLEAESLKVGTAATAVAANARPMCPADVGVIDDAAAFDAVLSVDYRRKGDSQILRITLVTSQKKLWSKTINAAGDSIRSARRKSKQADQGDATALSRPYGGASSLLDPQLASLGPTGMFQARSAGDDSEAGGSQLDLSEGAPGEKSKGEDPSELNKRVLQFALNHLGEQVGNGECWTLAAEALKAAGAKPARGYTFGKPIGLPEIMPGDILQFTSARFEEGNTWILMGMPNHTAIVQAVNDDAVHILHQNFGQKIVTTLEIDFDNMVTGEVQAFRPQARNGGNCEDGGSSESERNGRGPDSEECEDSEDSDTTETPVDGALPKDNPPSSHPVVDPLGKSRKR